MERLLVKLFLSPFAPDPLRFRRATAVLILGWLLLCPASSVADTEFSLGCAQPPCIPAILIHADDDGGETQTLIVDKHRQTAFLWSKRGHWRQVAQWTCSTGKSPGRKQLEGDQKTPEGIYFVTRDVAGRYLSKTYGTRALPLDYPNWIDRHANRNGSAIWLHGTNKPLKPRDSNGCVVFRNRAIDELAHRLTPWQTPVVVVDRMDWQPQSNAESKAKTILPIIRRWQQALMGGSYHRLKQWYAPGAAPSMSWWQRWCRLRNQKTLERGTYRSLIKHRMALASEDQWMVMFDHYLRHDQKDIWCGRIRMYLSVTGHRVRILEEQYLAHARAEEAGIARDPLFHAWRRITDSQVNDLGLETLKPRSRGPSRPAFGQGT